MSELPPIESYTEAEVYRLPTKPDLVPTDQVKVSTIGDPTAIDVVDAPHVIEQILPRGEVCLFAADGGAGKSTLSLSIAMHVAAGRDFANLRVEKGPVSYWSLEDRESTCWSRIKDIGTQLEFGKEELGDRLQIATSVNLGGALGGPSFQSGRHNQMEMTPLYAALQSHLAPNPALIVIDNASRAFTGNENARAEVDWFLDQLIQMAARLNSAVLLIAHLNKSAVTHGAKNNNCSGSTAWNNAPRSRLALRWDKGEGKLIHEKANLSAQVEPITITRSGSVLLATRPSKADRETQRSLQARKDAEAVLKVIKLAINKKQRIPANMSSSGNIYQFLRKSTDFPDIDNGSIRNALQHLETAELIEKKQTKAANGTTRLTYIAGPKSHLSSLPPHNCSEEVVGAS